MRYTGYRATRARQQGDIFKNAGDSQVGIINRAQKARSCTAQQMLTVSHESFEDCQQGRGREPATRYLSSALIVILERQRAALLRGRF